MIYAGVAEDILDTSYDTDESFLSANSDVDENDDESEALTSFARKTLALNLMKVFRENVLNLEVSVLLILRIEENRPTKIPGGSGNVENEPESEPTAELEKTDQISTDI